MNLQRFNVRFSSASIEDLRAIARRLEGATGDIAGAVRRTQEMLTFACSAVSLSQHSRQRDDIRKGLRTAPVGSTVVAFELIKDLQIVRVFGFFHAGQDFASILLDREGTDQG
jgi:plasmid stabilization system protein ParE